MINNAHVAARPHAINANHSELRIGTYFVMGDESEESFALWTETRIVPRLIENVFN